MSKKKLKLLSFRRQAPDGSLENRTALLLTFNRDLHPLEAAGLFHMLQQDMEHDEQERSS